MKKVIGTVLILISGAMLIGCNVGGAPVGPDAEQVKKIENSLPPDQQIALIQHSPMSASEKASRIAALKAQMASTPK